MPLKLAIARQYLHYFFTAANGKGHGTHPPFVYHFITHILQDKRQFYAYSEIPKQVKKVQYPSKLLPKYNELLFRMVNAYQPQQIVEWGTGNGITTLYLARANAHAKVYTISLNPIESAIAQRLLLPKVIQIQQCTHGTTIPHVIPNNTPIDFIFFNGGAAGMPPLNPQQIDALFAQLHHNSIAGFSHIYTCKAMQQAWQHAKQHALVTLSIDLFAIGIVFFRTENKAKQHHRIRF